MCLVNQWEERSGKMLQQKEGNLSSAQENFNFKWLQHEGNMSRRSYPRAIAPSFWLFRKTTNSSSNGDLKSFNPLLKRYTRALYNPCSRHNLTTYKNEKLLLEVKIEKRISGQKSLTKTWKVETWLKSNEEISMWRTHCSTRCNHPLRL